LAAIAHVFHAHAAGNCPALLPTRNEEIMTTRTEGDLVIDKNNNRASIAWWGSEAAAKKALKSCSDCSDCSRCSNCSNCFDCYNCSDCSRCSRCSPQQSPAESIPVIEDIHEKLYVAVSHPNALNMDEWHTCKTTHCRAGWVVHLAREAGYALEKKTSTLFAAMQIYKASGYLISPVRFFDNNETALADMKRLAEEGQP
jgi:hypothetical protein